MARRPFYFPDDVNEDSANDIDINGRMRYDELLLKYGNDPATLLQKAFGFYMHFATAFKREQRLPTTEFGPDRLKIYRELVEFWYQKVVAASAAFQSSL